MDKGYFAKWVEKNYVPLFEDGVEISEPQNPFPNEHAARLRNPNDFSPKTFRRTHGSGNGKVQGVPIPKSIDVIWGKLKGKDKPSDPVIAQALRFPTKQWTEAKARKWINDNKIKIIRFEPAKKSADKNQDGTEEGATIMPENLMSRNIFIFRQFDTEMSNEIVQTLLTLDDENNELPIKMYINSPGGMVSSLFTIIDTMNAIKSPVYTIAIGRASSAGAVLLSAGDKRFVGENARIMIHEVFAGAIGKIPDLRESMDEIEIVGKQIIETLAKNTGKPVAIIENDIFKFDKFMSAQEAIDYGLADEILTEETKRNFKLSDKMRGIPFKLSDHYNEAELSDVMLFRVGEYVSPAYGEFSFTERDLQDFIDNFNGNVRGIELSVENTHNNDNGEKPAWGWIKNLYPKNSGKEVWAKIKWTDEAKPKLADKQYQYVSPEFATQYYSEEGKRFKNVLLGGALTNRPFQKGEPMKLSENPYQIKELEIMDKELLIKKLSDEHKIDVNALLETEKKHTALAQENQTLKAELEKSKDLEAENKKLKEEAVKKEKETAFEELKNDNKVNEAMRENCMKKFDNGAEMKEFFASQGKVAHDKPIGDKGKSGETALDPKIIEMGKKHGLTEEDYKKYSSNEQK